MSLIFSAVLIITLIYPGLAFRAVYFKGLLPQSDISASLGNKYANKNKFKFLKVSMWEQVIASLLPALFIHVFAILIIQGAYKEIDFPLLYKLLSPSASDSVSIEQQSALGVHFIEFVGYISATIVIAIVSAIAVRYSVYRFNLDTFFSLLKFNSEWYYLLSGRIVDTPEFKKFFGDTTVSLIQIHALVETKEQTLIYDGYLYEYELDENGDGLQRIVLTNVERREMIKNQTTVKKILSDKEQTTTQEFFIKSDAKTTVGEQLMVIPYSQIKNMTITYVQIEQAN